MFRAYLVETMTGLVGPEVEMSTNGRYDITLNSVERGTVTCQKTSLTTIDARWFRAWATSVLITFEREDEEEVPLFAGPIVAPPDEYTDSLSFTVNGIRAIFEHRFLSSKDFGLSGGGMREDVLEYKNQALPYIAQDIVRRGMNKKAGELPIYFPNRIPSGAGSNERTYESFDLSNNNIDKRLGELSDVIGGPDIMFRPEWSPGMPHQYIRWGMYTGTTAGPFIPQRRTMVIDGGAPQPPISELSMNVSGDHYATRFYATGDGEGAGIRMAISENDQLYRDFHPLLEGHTSYPSVSVPSTLYAYSDAGVDIRPYIELHATVDGSDIRTQFGDWHVGDTAVVKPGPWHTIPDLEKPLRIVRASGDFDSPHVTLYFQEDQW